VQRIAPASNSHFLLRDHDLRPSRDAKQEIVRLLADDTHRPFDLEAGPLMWGLLIRLDDEVYALAITMHHIVSDGWSMGVFRRELSTLYVAFARGAGDPLPALPLQYADYAIWQRQWLAGDVLEPQAAYWTATLAGAPTLLALPTDHARPAQQEYAGAFV